MSGAAATLSLRAVTKRFETDAGSVDAVDGITLDVSPGSSVAITGPSGCGKSTLLSLIGALERPTSGSVEIGGMCVSDLAERERAHLRRELVGFVFQSPNLQPYLSAVENVSLQLALSEGSASGKQPVELLRNLGLEHALGKYPDQLSGGERRRVAVARALVHRPRLILADEPTGALDTDNSSIVVDLLQDARKEVGATLVVVTHDQAVAARFERTIALRDGRVDADSALEERLVLGRSEPSDV